MKKQKTIIILAVLIGLSFGDSALAADPEIQLSATPYSTIGQEVEISGKLNNPQTCSNRSNTNYAIRYLIAVDEAPVQSGTGLSPKALFTTTQAQHTVKLYFVCGEPDLSNDPGQGGWSLAPKILTIKKEAASGGTPPGGGGTPPAGNQCPPGQDGNPCKLVNPAKGQLVDTDNFPQLLSDIIKILLSFAGVVGVIFLIIGGYRYITSQGNEEGMEKAKKTITGALIGIVLIILSFAVVAIINNLLVKGP